MYYSKPAPIILLLVLSDVLQSFSQRPNDNFQFSVNGKRYKYSVDDSGDYTGGRDPPNRQDQKEYIPVIENGVPVDTPEVQKAKAEHFQLYARAAAEAERATQRDAVRGNGNRYYDEVTAYNRPYEATVPEENYYNNGYRDRYQVTGPVDRGDRRGFAPVRGHRGPNQGRY